MDGIHPCILARPGGEFSYRLRWLGRPAARIFPIARNIPVARPPAVGEIRFCQKSRMTASKAVADFSDKAWSVSRAGRQHLQRRLVAVPKA